ncbi:peptide-methionine (S)-S-oxide reductase MsrA [Litoribacter ruber]|nr:MULTISPECIES: peptide-methionine (S)-S-oxide reductase MsrA [Litoribacter]
MERLTLLTFAFLMTFAACGQKASNKSNKPMNELPKTEVNVPEGYEVATLGSGCFWCIEAIYQDLKGVEDVRSGYSGGHVSDPSYKLITSGTSGHAEVIQFYFDPKVISYSDVLEIFWSTHDPTTLNRQGNDVGPQYRSAVFYHTDEQRELAEHFKSKLNEEKVFDKPIVTEITPFSNFYVAEDYHQNYYKLNAGQAYCQYVIRPKVEKFKKVFADRLK